MDMYREIVTLMLAYICRAGLPERPDWCYCLVEHNYFSHRGLSDVRNQRFGRLSLALVSPRRTPRRREDRFAILRLVLVSPPATPRRREDRFAFFGLARLAAGGLVLAAASALALSPATASATVTRARPPRTVYAVTHAANSALYRLNPRTHTVIFEGHAGTYLADIAFRRRILYGISFTTTYRLNAFTGARRVGPLGLNGANALATQPGTDTLYGASHQGDFFWISARTGRATVIGTFGHHLGSAGDLTFAHGRLYATVSRRGSSRSLLATVNVRTGAARIVGNTGFKNVWGLVTGSRALYGATFGGNFLAISPATGRARVIWREGLPVSGLAVP